MCFEKIKIGVQEVRFKYSLDVEMILEEEEESKRFKY